MENDKIAFYAQALDFALDSFRRTKFTSHEACSPLKRSEIFVLKLISEFGEKQPVISSELAKGLGVTLAAVTHHINSLEAEGYVIRTLSEEDRRVIFLSLSKKGTKAVTELDQLHRKKLGEMVKHLGENDTRKLISIVEKMTDYISKGKKDLA